MTDAKHYAALIGKRVEVFYRTSDLHLSSAGVLTSDTGKAISIEEHFTEDGRPKTLRVEIPYDYITRVIEMEAMPPAPSEPGPPSAT